MGNKLVALFIGILLALAIGLNAWSGRYKIFTADPTSIIKYDAWTDRTYIYNIERKSWLLLPSKIEFRH